MKTHLKKVAEGEHRLPPKWRLAVSARPALWIPSNTARCHEYRILARYGEACVRYILGTESNAREILEQMAKTTKIRREHRDEIDLPLLSYRND